MTIERTARCPHCRQLRQVKPSRARRRPFCNRACAARWRNEQGLLPAPPDETTNALILTHLDLPAVVARVCLRRWPSHIERDEVEAVGSLALVDAARRYGRLDGPAITFRVYAYAFIRRRLRHACRDGRFDQTRLIRGVPFRIVASGPLDENEAVA